MYRCWPCRSSRAASTAATTSVRYSRISRESGSIEQDADVVMFIFREAYYLKSRKPEEDDPEFAKWSEKWERVEHLADVIVEKHRHGPTTKIELFFDDRFTRFKDLSERGL